MLRVIALLRQHLLPDDLRRFLQTWRFSSMGRCFPCLFEAMPGIFIDRPARINGVDLLVADKVDSSRVACLGPSCQCCAHERHWQNELQTPREERDLMGTRSWAMMRKSLRQFRRVQVPRHVAYPVSGPSGWRYPACACTREAPCAIVCQGLLTTQPRFELRRKTQRSPAGFDANSKF